MSTGRIHLWMTLLVLAICTHSARSEPIESLAAPNGLSVVLHNDDCNLKHLITNLPHKAVHTDEKGVVTEGCWGPHFGLVMLFYADKTVGAIPRNWFSPASRL